LISSQWTWKDCVVAKSGAVCLFMGIFVASGPPVAISGIGRKNAIKCNAISTGILLRKCRKQL